MALIRAAGQGRADGSGGVSDGCGKMLGRGLIRLGENWGRLGRDGDRLGRADTFGVRKLWITEEKEVTCLVS